MGRKHKTRSLLSPFTIVVLTVFISAFVARFYTDAENERPTSPFTSRQSQNPRQKTAKFENHKKAVPVDQENPDILIEAFAEIKRGYDGTTYRPGYRSEQLKEARSRLSLLKNAPRVDIDWKESGTG